MLDWTILESPINFPHYCIACMNGRGPVAATHRTMPGFGDVYLCENCAEKLARMFGFAPGDRMDEIVKAAKRVTELERDNAKLAQAVTDARTDIKHYEATLQQREEEILGNRARMKQLEERIREEATVSLSLVGGNEAA